jgi:putative membrane protein
MSSLNRQNTPLFFLLAYLISMPIYCLGQLADQPAWVGPSTALTAASLFAFSLTYAIARHGLGRAIAMLMASFAVALTLEYLGSSTGFLFGDYDYTDRLGPQLLGKVPAIIPVAWFMMLYPAWATSDFLLTRVGARAAYGLLNAGMRITVAALAMTAWDLSLDPRMVADGNWIWETAGPYFGIPLSNYLGWFVTAALIYIIWHALIGAGTAQASSEDCAALSFCRWPVWAYIITWLGESLANAAFWGRPLVALCVFLGMGLFGGPALVNLWRSAQQTSTHPLVQWLVASAVQLRQPRG